ncbi:hypothetical protein [Streptomyces daliensis]
MSMSPRRCTVSRLLATAAAVSAAVLTVPTAQAAAPATPQAAAPANVSCQAGGTAEFSPGLLPIPVPRDTNVQYTGQDHSCTGSTAEGAEIATATFNGAFDVPMSCEIGGSSTPATGSGTVTWKTKDGQTLKSSLSLTITGQMFNSATIDGNVTDGAFLGGKVHGKFKVDLLREGINCAAQSFTGGLRKAAYDGSFTINA